MTQYYNTRIPTQSLDQAFQILGIKLFTPVNKILSWNEKWALNISSKQADILNTMDISSMNGDLLKWFEVLFNNCKPLSEIYTLDIQKSTISYLDTITDEEKWNIRNYIANNKTKPRLFSH